jgi:hypothetical protein
MPIHLLPTRFALLSVQAGNLLVITFFSFDSSSEIRGNIYKQIINPVRTNYNIQETARRNFKTPIWVAVLIRTTIILNDAYQACPRNPSYRTSCRKMPVTKKVEGSG